MGLGGRGGRSSGRSYGGGSGANMGAVAGASRLFKSAPASLSSSESLDYSKRDEEQIKWLYKYSKESRCRKAASYLFVCEEIRSPGHPRCDKYREVLADCPGGEKGTRHLESFPAPLSSARSVDDINWDDAKWLYKFSKDSRCRMALSCLDVCEEIRSPGHSKCNKYREVLADCPGRERASPSSA